MVSGIPVDNVGISRHLVWGNIHRWHIISKIVSRKIKTARTSNKVGVADDKR